MSIVDVTVRISTQTSSVWVTFSHYPKFLAPGIGIGQHTVQATVAGTTASSTFFITPTGSVPGEITPVEEALASLGDRLEGVAHFNNDSKVWTFYRPELAELNTMQFMVAGEPYLIQVRETVEEVLNGRTRTLTCHGGNCWNQIVW